MRGTEKSHNIGPLIVNKYLNSDKKGIVSLTSFQSFESEDGNFSLYFQYFKCFSTKVPTGGFHYEILKKNLNKTFQREKTLIMQCTKMIYKIQLQENQDINFRHFLKQNALSASVDAVDSIHNTKIENSFCGT